VASPPEAKINKPHAVRLYLSEWLRQALAINWSQASSLASAGQWVSPQLAKICPLQARSGHGQRLRQALATDVLTGLVSSPEAARPRSRKADETHSLRVTTDAENPQADELWSGDRRTWITVACHWVENAKAVLWQRGKESGCRDVSQ
jgi:hypothetical protein